MATELRKTFPDATDSEITCHQVRESHSYVTFTLIIYSATVVGESSKNPNINGECEFICPFVP